MTFHDDLKKYIHEYIMYVYKISEKFPKSELYGMVSQIRRAAVSIMLNYVEGFARRKGFDSKVYINFMETSYGSFKESKYLLFLAFELKFINHDEYTQGINMADNIGCMLWGIIKPRNP